MKVNVSRRAGKKEEIRNEVGLMMINKRLIGTVSESKKYIAGNVTLQWCSLVANIAMMTMYRFRSAA
ncbi:MAG: hypothetical protein NC305_13060 [Lachnospiraceae bacterium]|nr:hypothetical protein [Butyrivibrio sp.]MCM1343980.1 hypothetical protein [Muribaculaceae bacterium]MCM1411462.1 hypothetical protein [Lachnospiraceae bacterium]